ncbi:hypothetical protein M413DRAFT_29780 [Hebeloma cylindrosporum]|uniref:Uncharacterized protein n=1 Tax=Hebeloma cylindrosporum TaxID=76867 RepID=A0A0C3BQA0_HEBCY|nr:hypothetical protein M413DRAFT_29780 [Hebeloma cylindrosporum h7]
MAQLNMCVAISVCKAVVGQFGMILVELILLIRVYALYNQSYQMKYILVGSFTIATLLETTGTVILVRSLFPLVAACQPPKASRKGLLVFGTGAGFCQCIIFIMTSYKFVTRRSSGWARTPLTSLILKEGVITFILVLGMIVHEVVRNLNPDGEIAAFSWYISFISIGASRLILSIRKVAVERRQLQSMRQQESGDSSSALYELDDLAFLDSFHE